MKLIEREELKRALTERDDIKLVCALGETAFRAMHIPGSMHIDTMEKAAELLSPDDCIVVYCASVHCPLSIGLCQQLLAKGYKDVRRYAGGLEDWEGAGYPVEGDTP